MSCYNRIWSNPALAFYADVPLYVQPVHPLSSPSMPIAGAGGLYVSPDWSECPPMILRSSVREALKWAEEQISLRSANTDQPVASSKQASAPPKLFMFPRMHSSTSLKIWTRACCCYHLNSVLKTEKGRLRRSKVELQKPMGSFWIITFLKDHGLVALKGSLHSRFIGWAPGQ